MPRAVLKVVCAVVHICVACIPAPWSENAHKQNKSNFEVVGASFVRKYNTPVLSKICSREWPRAHVMETFVNDKIKAKQFSVGGVARWTIGTMDHRRNGQ